MSEKFILKIYHVFTTRLQLKEPESGECYIQSEAELKTHTHINSVPAYG